MKPKSIHTPNAPQAIGPYSQAMGLGDLIFTSGSIALQANGEFVQGGIKEQSEQVMQNLQAVLEASGSGLEYVLKTTCFLADMGDFAVFNEVYAKAFGTHKPARSTISVKSLPKDALVEVEVIATKKVDSSS